MTFNYYRVTTAEGGSLDIVAVDTRYDTPREREHRAWCKLLEDDRSEGCRMAMRLVKELGVDRTKAMFCAALIFEKVE